MKMNKQNNVKDSILKSDDAGEIFFGIARMDGSLKNIEKDWLATYKKSILFEHLQKLEKIGFIKKDSRKKTYAVLWENVVNEFINKFITTENTIFEAVKGALQKKEVKKIDKDLKKLYTVKNDKQVRKFIKHYLKGHAENAGFIPTHVRSFENTFQNFADRVRILHYFIRPRIKIKKSNNIIWFFDYVSTKAAHSGFFKDLENMKKYIENII